LYNILSLDTKKRTVWVEPLVTVGEATAFLNPKGWTLEVTLEIMDATVGEYCVPSSPGRGGSGGGGGEERGRKQEGKSDSTP
jgi:hypothetical protein